MQCLNFTSIEGDNFFYKNYQQLEFIGDAIFEVYVQVNGFKYIEKYGLEVIPDQMHSSKISLLSNQFMSRMAIMLDLHSFFFNISADEIQEVDEFI